VLTFPFPFPFPWRRRLAQDGALLGNLTRIFVEAVHAFCTWSLSMAPGTSRAAS